jgi:GDP-L-fucose synthase
MNTNEKILITGANGLVGSALVEHLINKGYKNIIRLGRSECDLIDSDATKKFFIKHKPHYVFHSAARVYGIMGNIKNKGLSFYDNIMINTNVIEASKNINVKKITVMGTGAVYPYPSPGIPLEEKMIFLGEPHEAEDSYAHAKRAMLAMLRAYEESYNMKWAFVVSCNLFGPRDKYDTEFGHVIPSLIKKFYDAKCKNEKVVIWGDGTAERDFLYVKDAAKACYLIMKNINGPVNMGSGNIYKIRDIVDMISEVSKMSGNIVWDKTKPNGQDYRAYDLKKLNLNGFKYDYSIKEGIKETWEWYLENIKNKEEKY